MNTQSELTTTAEALARTAWDVVVIGSGPAGVAVARRLYEKSDLSVAVLERGGIVSLSHFSNLFDPPQRHGLMQRFKRHPWEGAFKEGGMLIPALGGRGIAAGCLLRRFDEVDFTMWPEGAWPEPVIRDLPAYYEQAELDRRVNLSAVRGPAQTWLLGRLAG
ncbi:MAG: hypothetical protein AAF492_19095, partial [Verrucomicrobiota bacterium]